MGGGGASGGNDLVAGDRFGGKGGREKIAPQVSLGCSLGAFARNGKRVAGRYHLGESLDLYSVIP